MALPDPPPLRITEEADGATTVLRLAGELDLATADRLREQVAALLGRRAGVQHLALDLAGLEFVDVTGVGALLEIRRKLATAGATLSLRRPRPMVVRVLGLLALDDTLRIDG